MSDSTRESTPQGVPMVEARPTGLPIQTTTTETKNPGGWRATVSNFFNGLVHRGSKTPANVEIPQISNPFNQNIQLRTGRPLSPSRNTNNTAGPITGREAALGTGLAAAAIGGAALVGGIAGRPNMDATPTPTTSPRNELFIDKTPTPGDIEIVDPREQVQVRDAFGNMHQATATAASAESASIKATMEATSTPLAQMSTDNARATAQEFNKQSPDQQATITSALQTAEARHPSDPSVKATANAWVENNPPSSFEAPQPTSTPQAGAPETNDAIVDAMNPGGQSSS